MSGVLNDCDALLQAASVRILNPDSAFINLTASAPGFHVTGAGTVDLATVTITADLIALDGDVVFTGQGVTLSNVKPRSVDATYVNGTGIVTATVVTNGETFARSWVIPVLRDGAAGAAGQPVYTWIKYADSAAGAGLSDDPSGKTYIGLAHNKPTAAESTNPADYAWAQLKGGDGLPGTKGADGITYYTWIKYADQADGTGLYDVPNAGTLYIGIAVNRTTAVESTTKTDYVWSRFKGEQGVAGAPTYTWIKYADSAAGAGLSDDPTGKLYIGFAYNKSTATESTTAADYTWALIKGTDGQPGGKGADGATLYTWIKYSDVADGTGLYDTPTASTLYIGIATNKSTATESTTKTDYVWSKFKGDQGVQGPTTYTWVKYADSAAGAGLSDDPTGKAYIGFAYNKTTASESTTATDYTWSLIKGTDGQPGGKGADGATLYTWIKYSDQADGTGLYDLPTASTQYLGIAVNKSTATESTVKTDYVWSKFRGADGVGTAGARGAGHYYVAGSSWSDVVAQAACPGGPVINDVVTISSSTFVMEKRWTGSAWVENGVVIDGKLIVRESILATAIDTRGLTVRAPDGTILLGSGVPLAESLAAPGTRNSEAAFSPKLAWNFRGSLEGWTTARATLVSNVDSITLSGTANDPNLLSPPFSIYGPIYDKVRVRIRRVSGTGWDGRMFYTVAGGSTFEEPTTSADPTKISEFCVIEWDMRLAFWKTNTVIGLRFDFGQSANDVFEIDSIYIGTAAPTNIRDLGFDGALDATNGATIGINLNGQFNAGNVPSLFVPGSLTDTQIGGNLKSSNWNGSTSTDGAGWLLERATGNLYANLVKLRGAVMGGDYTSYAWVSGKRSDNSWKRGYYIGEEGALWGNPDSGRFFQIDGGNIHAPNFTIIDGVPTFTSPRINNPVYTAFGVSAGGTWSASGRYGSVSFGSRTATVTGADNLESIFWTIDYDDRYGSFYLSSPNSQTISLDYDGPAPGQSATLTVTAVGKDGRTVRSTVTVNATILSN